MSHLEKFDAAIHDLIESAAITSLVAGVLKYHRNGRGLTIGHF